MLFEALNRSPQLVSLDAESHLLWELYHGIDRGRLRSHSVDPSEITRRERRALYWAIDKIARGRRYLDKSPRNALRVPYLHGLFPDAAFVFLKRDGRAAISSLITGWRATGSHFPGTSLPAGLEIEGYEGENWKFLVPPGWESYASGHTLAEVCAFQWVAANEAILRARKDVPSERWFELTYEDLVERPEEAMVRLLSGLGLGRDEEVLRYTRDLDRHVTRAVSPPRRDKWREENLDEVQSVLPVIAPTMRRLGYEIEGSKGEPL